MLDGCVPWPEALAARYRADGVWEGRGLEQFDDLQLAKPRGASGDGKKHLGHTALTKRGDELVLAHAGVLAALRHSLSTRPSATVTPGAAENNDFSP